jgi:glutamate-ammonia-ligase adenylyltransferase
MSHLDFLNAPDPPPEQVREFLDRYHLSPTPSVLNNLKSIRDSLSFQMEPEDLLLPILEKVRETASPEKALNQLERFFQRLDDPGKFFSLLQSQHRALQTLCILFGASPYLTSILHQDPDLFLWLMEESTWSTPVNRESLVRGMLDTCDGIRTLDQAYPVLRQIKKREILKIGAKDLTGFADFSETTWGLTLLAEATLETAYRLADGFLKMRYGTPQSTDENGSARECPFAVLGMGKLGGAELNFSSDIDLLFLYETDRGETTGIPDGNGGIRGKVENHFYFTRLSEKITDMMHANTEDGFVFRVDLRLRPEGAQGPVASSLRSYELYYESFGQTWERAAHLKCRPAAGDLELGRDFNDMLRPFVFRKYLDYTAIDEIKEMKRKILRELTQKPARGYNVKLGHGGIREIEFFVQALQLIHGGRITWVREKNTLRALHRLCDKELVTYEDFSTLSKAYLFFRDVEHKLQIENQLQTQTLPQAPDRLDQLARRCGYPDREPFLKALEEHRARVQALFENLFYEKEGPPADGGSPLEATLRGEANAAESRQVLSGYGFKDPRQAYKNISLLREGPPYRHSSSRCRALFLKAAPALLQTMAASADPDMALNHFERFVSEYGAREAFYELLGDNAEVRERLVSLFSMSSYLSNLMIRHHDTIEIILGKDLMEPGPDAAALFRTLTAGLSHEGSPFSKVDFIRRFKRVEEMKIGLRDILLHPDILETSRDLSHLADACLEGAYTMAREELTEKFGAPMGPSNKEEGFAILGAGKLGSKELTYGADLDLLFVYSDEGETSGPRKLSNRDFFAKLAGRIVAILSSLSGEGVAYRIDLRLRPLGESGPLVQSISGYKNYFERNLQNWERQAMTRVRFSAGDRSTAARLLTLIEESLYHSPPAPDLREQVFDMRMRIEREKSKPLDNHLYFKTGAGGLIDIEFLVQYWQLLHGRETAQLRSLPPLPFLEMARELGLLGEADFRILRESYLFLRRLESRARIVQDRPINSLSSDPAKNRALALRMGYLNQEGASPGQQLLRDYEKVTRNTREIFLRFLAKH